MEDELLQENKIWRMFFGAILMAEYVFAKNLMGSTRLGVPTVLESLENSYKQKSAITN